MFLIFQYLHFHLSVLHSKNSCKCQLQLKIFAFNRGLLLSFFFTAGLWLVRTLKHILDLCLFELENISMNLYIFISDKYENDFLLQTILFWTCLWWQSFTLIFLCPRLMLLPFYPEYYSQWFLPFPLSLLLCTIMAGCALYKFSPFKLRSITRI